MTRVGLTTSSYRDCWSPTSDNGKKTATTKHPPHFNALQYMCAASIFKGVNDKAAVSGCAVTYCRYSRVWRRWERSCNLQRGGERERERALNSLGGLPHSLDLSSGLPIKCWLGGGTKSLTANYSYRRTPTCPWSNSNPHLTNLS